MARTQEALQDELVCFLKYSCAHDKGKYFSLFHGHPFWG